MSKHAVAVAGMILLIVAALALLPMVNGEKGIASAQTQDWDRLQNRIEQMQQKLETEIAELHAKLAHKMAELDHKHRAKAERRLEELLAKAEVEEQLARAEQHAWRVQEEAGELAERLARDQTIVIGDDDSGWLGVTIDEVTSEKAKELKLPAERGVYVREVSSESPAAKAGLKAGDVITEFNGQRIEGTAQFRRLVRETPPGRAVQLSVWREGRTQSISVTLGSLGEHSFSGLRVFGPRDFDFRIEMPRIEALMSRTPTIGIQADDLSGQLGSYFGVPEGEGVLVREVRSGSPAEKAGLKAGDVIIKVEGERIRTTSDLRSKLRQKREQNTVSLGVIRNRSEVSLNVTIEKPAPPESSRPKRTISFRMVT